MTDPFDRINLEPGRLSDVWRFGHEADDKLSNSYIQDAMSDRDLVDTLNSNASRSTEESRNDMIGKLDGGGGTQPHDAPGAAEPPDARLDDAPEVPAPFPEEAELLRGHEVVRDEMPPSDFQVVGEMPDGDIEGLAYQVLMEAAKSSQEDVRTVMDGISHPDPVGDVITDIDIDWPQPEPSTPDPAMDYGGYAGPSDPDPFVN